MRNSASPVHGAVSGTAAKLPSSKRRWAAIQDTSRGQKQTYFFLLDNPFLYRKPHLQPVYTIVWLHWYIHSFQNRVSYTFWWVYFAYSTSCNITGRWVSPKNPCRDMQQGTSLVASHTRSDVGILKPRHFLIQSYPPITAMVLGSIVWP